MATKTNKPAKEKHIEHPLKRKDIKLDTLDTLDNHIPQEEPQLKVSSMLLLAKCSDGKTRQIIFPEKAQRAVKVFMEALDPNNSMQVHENAVDVNWENNFDLSK